MFKVEMSFATQAELLAFFTGNGKQPPVLTDKAPADPRLADKAAAGAADPKPVKPALAVVKTADKPPAAEAPPKDTPPAGGPTPTSAAMPYASLQKAVFTLSAKSREATTALMAKLGVGSFKEYMAEERAAERAGALKAVEEAIAQLEAEVPA